ncbi:MAG: twin-arginine translocase subunit TatC [Balneolaceae bacterium]
MSKKKNLRGIMGKYLPGAKAPKEDPTASMSFLDHLEELRWRIIKGLLGILTGVIVAFFYADFIIDEVILGPTRADFIMYRIMPLNAVDLELINLTLPGQFFTYWGTLIIAGIIIGSPILFYQIYAFLEPALETGQKLRTAFNVSFITMFFMLGVSFGYFILVPFAVQFFAQFNISDVIANQFNINDFFISVSLWVLCCGIIFQIPVVSYFLSRIGLVTPDGLRQYRRHAIVGALILSAFLTPPDPISQLLIGIPLVLLYQLAIWVSKVAHRQREEEFEAAMSGDDE